MPGCLHRCVSFSADTYFGVWEEARNHYGPRPLAMALDTRLDLYNSDLAEYYGWLAEWNATYGGVSDSVTQFAKWLNWRFSIGTSYLNNLPKRKMDHTGISCLPCPYDNVTEELRRDYLLGVGFSGSLVAHGNHYMKVAQRGSVWGFECTYDGCPYYLDNGVRYFYV